MDINYKGEFTSIEAVWERYPEGGIEGDYLYINSVKYRWNKYDCIWENAETVTDSPARRIDNFDGDVHVQNDLVVGGTLRAKKVKQPNCGLFATEAALNAAFPKPEVGMWAAVGDTLPADIYRCNTEGVWEATGEVGPTDTTIMEAYTRDEADERFVRSHVTAGNYRKTIENNDDDVGILLEATNDDEEFVEQIKFDEEGIDIRTEGEGKDINISTDGVLNLFGDNVKVNNKPVANTDAATQTTSGLMSGQDKRKLDNNKVFHANISDAPTADVLNNAIAYIQDVNDTDFITFLPSSTMGMKGSLFQFEDEWYIITGQIDDITVYETYEELFEWANENSTRLSDAMNDISTEWDDNGSLHIKLHHIDGSKTDYTIPKATESRDGLMTPSDKNNIGRAIYFVNGVPNINKYGLRFLRENDTTYDQDIPAVGEYAGVMTPDMLKTLNSIKYVANADDTPTSDLFHHSVSLIRESQTDYITFLPVSTMGMRGAMYQYMGEWRIITENVLLSAFDDYSALFEWADAHSEPIATGGSRRDLYIAAGATYDATTGHYSLNGLTDITEEQMAAIYFDTYRKCGGHDMSFAYYGAKARTNFHPRNGHWGPDHMICVGMFQQSDIETAYMSIVDAYTDILRSFFPVVDNAQQMFYNCTKLVKVNGPLLIEEASSLGGMFYNCDKLEDVEIIGLSSELEIESPVLTFKSLRDMVTYASDSISEAIDVTVDADIWDLLNGGHAPHDGHTTEEWQEINTDALEKNIRFVYQ